MDDDCNGPADDGLTQITYYVDLDGDGYGDPNSTPITDCVHPGGSYVADASDCDDTNDQINPVITGRNKF